MQLDDNELLNLLKERLGQFTFTYSYSDSKWQLNKIEDLINEIRKRVDCQLLDRVSRLEAHSCPKK